MDKFDSRAKKYRTFIRDVGVDVKGLLDDTVFYQIGETPHQNRPEMKANIMLAFRHLEDARMRLGKAIQAYDGGTSVYDK